jgi:hypothetical protein
MRSSLEFGENSYFRTENTHAITPPDEWGRAAQQNPLAQLFSDLGQALQSGNLSAAQQAYTTLQQDFQSTSSNSAPTSSSTA